MVAEEQGSGFNTAGVGLPLGAGNLTPGHFPGAVQFFEFLCRSHQGLKPLGNVFDVLRFEILGRIAVAVKLRVPLGTKCRLRAILRDSAIPVAKVIEIGLHLGGQFWMAFLEDLKLLAVTRKLGHGPIKCGIEGQTLPILEGQIVGFAEEFTRYLRAPPIAVFVLDHILRKVAGRGISIVGGHERC